MKQTILTIAIISFLTSCISKETKPKILKIVSEMESDSTIIFNYNDVPRGVSIQTIDSCEYIFSRYDGLFIIHKYNCSNPSHLTH